eukprot:RCo004429
MPSVWKGMREALTPRRSKPASTPRGTAPPAEEYRGKCLSEGGLTPRPLAVAAQPQAQTPVRRSEGPPAAVTASPLPELRSVGIVLGPLVGAGSLAKVYVASHGPQSSGFALKVLNKALVASQGHTRYLFREKEILARLQHPFLVNLLATFQSDVRLFFAMEFLHGDLQGVLRECPSGRLSEPAAQTAAAEIALALEHLHRNGVIHRDLKPSNILVDGSGHIRVTGLGNAKDFVNADLYQSPHLCEDLVGSLGYTAPEVFSKQPYSYAVDFWSLGIVLFEMLCGVRPFPGRSWAEVCDQVVRGQPLFSAYPWLSPQAVNVLRRLLRKSDRERLTAALMREHPFFEAVDWENPRSGAGLPVPSHRGCPDLTQTDNVGQYYTETGLSPAQQAQFQGFSWVAEHAQAMFARRS